MFIPHENLPDIVRMIGYPGLFAIVFLWQIPHFMAIAWLFREDYGRAGFPMLPVIVPDGRRTGR